MDFTRVPIQEYDVDLTTRSSIMEELKKKQQPEKKVRRTSNETMDTFVDNEDKLEFNKLE